MKVTFEQKKKKLQEFYDNWMKPMKDIMSSNMLVEMEDMIKKYSLIK